MNQEYINDIEAMANELKSIVNLLTYDDITLVDSVRLKRAATALGVWAEALFVLSQWEYKPEYVD